MPEEGLRPTSPGSSRRAEPDDDADDPGGAERAAPQPQVAQHAQHDRGPDADPGELAQALLDAMAAIRRTARRVARRPALLSNLTGSQIELVRAVRQRPGISVADAAEELRLAPNTVSTLVGQLTDAGIIVRTADRADRRVARLALNPDAARSVLGWYDRRTEAVAAVLARVSPSDRRRLHDAQAVLATVAALLEEDAVADEDATDRRLGRGRSPRRAGTGTVTGAKRR